MSDLYPEDILNQRLSLRDMAKDALEAFETTRKARDEEARDAEAEELVDEVWYFMTHTLELPEHLLEDVSFSVESPNPGKARITWVIDGIHLRAFYAEYLGQRKPVFEVRSGAAQFGQAWKTFTDLVGLGRLV